LNVGATIVHEAATDIETARLILRPFTLSDVPSVQRLAGSREIADTTLLIPHPYSEEHARAFIIAQQEAGIQGKGFVYAVELKELRQLIGSIGFKDVEVEHAQAEMGFWIGVEYWRHGYATEAARALVRHGFENLGLNRICAHHMVRNPASGRVLEKTGMHREGVLRQRIRKWGVFEDVVALAILRQEWLQQITTKAAL
jgi:RimJ/RimL family protein N-acetyltransferase